jgi:hypothetical protein
MCRPSSPDPGAALHASRSSTGCGNNHSSSAWSIAWALYLACTQTMSIIAEPLLTCACVPPKHVEVAPHGHHAVTGSRARYDVELLPLLVHRRETKKIIRGEICTVQHAHTRVNLKYLSYDDAILCRGPPVHHLPLDMNMLNGTPNGTRGARIAVMCRPASPDFCAALHGTPLEYRMWQQAQQQRVEHRLGDLSGMHPDDDHHRTAPPHLLW